MDQEIEKAIGTEIKKGMEKEMTTEITNGTTNEPTSQMTNEMPQAAETNSKPKKGISGSTLKMIAIVTMLIDHVGAALVTRILIVNGYLDVFNSGDMQVIMSWLQENAALYYTCMIMRLIGRVAFPIFIFLMVEGFEKTRSKTKYAARLGLFALISEIPFDLAFNAKVLEFSYQNVFFTLFIGFLAMMAVDFVNKKKWHVAVRVILTPVIVLLAAAVASLLNTDYGAIGIICIMVMYMFRQNKVGQIIAGCVAFLWEGTAPLAFIPIGFYNGKRGWNLKYVFYAFYPLHLLIIYLICMAMGIHGYAAI